MAEEVQFFYEKSNHFRVVHADGVYGGITPMGYLHFALYNERHPIPKVSALPISDGRPAGPEVVKEKKDGIFREVEVDVIMDINIAIAFKQWLDEKVKALKAHHGIADDVWEKMVKGDA